MIFYALIKAHFSNSRRFALAKLHHNKPKTMIAITFFMLHDTKELMLSHVHCIKVDFAGLIMTITVACCPLKFPCSKMLVPIAAPLMVLA